MGTTDMAFEYRLRHGPCEPKQSWSTLYRKVHRAKSGRRRIKKLGGGTSMWESDRQLCLKMEHAARKCVKKAKKAYVEELQRNWNFVRENEIYTELARARAGHPPADPGKGPAEEVWLATKTNGKAFGPDGIPSEKEYGWSDASWLADLFKQEKRLRWYRHVSRGDEKHVTRVAMSLEVAGKRPQGRPTMRWMDRISTA
ncbi:unnamed protein product [Strongylus vulgaris]|uniref:Uncharacterized protein n=1 Tax=Strongylus vulgaris TaxID=40348 RepID=A0A3P7IIE7_STRVU|nr:unnamed protein product [Strongylus vulgaris]